MATLSVMSLAFNSKILMIMIYDLPYDLPYDLLSDLKIKGNKVAWSM